MSRAGAVGATPRTTATFLFTDIESHTPLWEANPDAMAAALTTHDALLRETVAAAGGRVVKFGGDAVMAVFGSADAAVAAAYAAQHALDEAEWPVVGTLRVRMGLHTGAAYERDGDYFGSEVIRAARLCEAAHGRQVIGSSTIAALTPSYQWIDLGGHRLRGLDGEERVYQLAAPALRTEFPPLRTAESRRDRLPQPRTSFVGRGRELDAIAVELSTHRLVTLTGVGGSGKTRLAIEAARAAPAAFPDGAEFVDLSTVTDEEGTYPAVAAAFGLETSPGIAEAVDRRIHGYLEGRRALVVIDNCEHLLDAVAELVDAIMQSCEDVRILATSREPLRVEDERVVQVGSLDVAEDAVALFRDRAAGPVGDDDAIRRICERLDGIPLAIELAAARTSHLSLEDIAERLDDRFRLLTGGRRRVQRQQTLQAALDWSHDLLTSDERKLLRSLAVFSGPIRLDALEGICGRDYPDVIAVLGSLVERSMVNHDPGQRRYRLLETVRLYAEQKLLEAGEADEYRRRHRDWFLAHVCSLPLDECFFPGGTSRRIATDIEDLRAALRWSYDGDDDVAAAEITTHMAWAAVCAESQEVAGWATTLVPRLDLESELAFHCFLAGAWSGANTRSRETSESAEVPVHVYLRRMSGVFELLMRLAEARTDDVSVFARAFAANSLYAFGLVLGDDAQCDAARRVSDHAVAMADARSPSAWCGYAPSHAALTAIAGGRLERAAALLRRCIVESDDLVQGIYDPLLALVLHALGDPDAYEVATRAQVRTDSDPNVVTAAIVIALELAARNDQLGARKELRATIPEVARSVVMMRTAWLIGAAGVAIHDGDHERAARWLACASSAGGVFTAPQGWVLFQRYTEQLHDVLPESDRDRLREEGRSMPLAAALDEVEAWCEEAPPLEPRPH